MGALRWGTNAFDTATFQKLLGLKPLQRGAMLRTELRVSLQKSWEGPIMASRLLMEYPKNPCSFPL